MSLCSESPLLHRSHTPLSVVRFKQKHRNYQAAKATCRCRTHSEICWSVCFTRTRTSAYRGRYWILSRDCLAAGADSAHACLIRDELLHHPFWHGCSPLAKVKMPEQELFDAGSPSYLRFESYPHFDLIIKSCVDLVECSRVPEVEKPQSCAVAAMNGSRPFASDSEQDVPEHDTGVEDGSPSNNNSPSAQRGFPSSDEVENKAKSSYVKLDRPVSAPVLPTKSTTEKRDSARANSTKLPSQRRIPDSAGAGNNLATATKTSGRDGQNNNIDVAELAKLPSTAPAAPIERRSPSRIALLETAFDRDGKPGGGLRKLPKLMFTAADCCVKPIVWSDEIEHLSLPPSRPELLPFAVMTADQRLSSDTDTLERHLKEIYINLKRSDMTTEEAAALMVHLFTYCCHPKLANVIINSSILSLLTKTLPLDSSRSPQRSPVLAGMTCLVVGVLFRFAAFFAPTSTNQVQSLLQGLIIIADQAPSIEPDTRGQSSAKGLDPRRLAISCLGEMLFYMSTQKEWQAATFAWDRLISALRDDDLIVRHYAVRTLCNTLSSCRDESLLSKLMSKQIVAILARSIVEYSGIHDKRPETAVILDVWTTSTQLVVQVLRHLRSPVVKSRSASLQKCSVLLLLAKRNVIRALWCGLQSGVTAERSGLAIASLNVVNVFLELKLDGCRDTETETIELARGDLLERVVSFPEMNAVLEAKAKLIGRRQNQLKLDRSTYRSEATVEDNDASEEEESTLLQAKVVILLYLGIQSSRAFVDRCLQAQVMRLVEHIFAPLATIVRNGQHRCESASASSSFATTATSSGSVNGTTGTRGVPAPGSSPNASETVDALSSLDSHLLQCLMNLVKMSIHTALKLGAECISANERVSESGTGRVTIVATPFKLLESLLRNPACLLQLVHYFVVNDNKQYTFFLRLMTKMLVVFPSENLLEADVDMTTVGVSLGHILLRLFQCATTDAREIVTVESEILYMNLLPALADLISRDPGTTATDNSAELSVTSIRIIYLVLLQFDGNEAEAQITKYRETFVRTCLLPRLYSLLMSDHDRNENVWRFAVELLFGLLSKDESLLAGADAKVLVPAIVQLLDTPSQRNYHSLPSSATKMAKMVAMRGRQGVDQQLYDADIVRCLLSALRFATGEALGGCLMDLLEILLQLLHSRYEVMRKVGSSALAPPAPRQFDNLRDSGPLLTQLCAVHQDRASPSTSGESVAADDSSVDGESPRKGQRAATSDHEAAVADLASRCLIFLSQVRNATSAARTTLLVLTLCFVTCCSFSLRSSTTCCLSPRTTVARPLKASSAGSGAFEPCATAA